MTLVAGYDMLAIEASPVMPGHSSLPCADYVYLSAPPGIHVFLLSKRQDVDGRNIGERKRRRPLDGYVRA
jgi:hypothetical protein